MDEIGKYLIEEALIIVPVLWVIGVFLKYTSFLADEFIPWILTLCGICFAVGLLGFSVANVMQGILAAGAAVLVHQLYKQTKQLK